MIGEKAYQNALRRRAELRQELQDIETFLMLCERFAGDDSAEDTRDKVGVSGTMALTTSVSARPSLDENAVEIGGNALRPHIRKAILDVGRPLSRVDTVHALHERGIRVAGQDPVTNVGTVMWRAKGEFVNLKPYGYWPRDVPYAPARYYPASHAPENEDDASVNDGGRPHSDDEPEGGVSQNFTRNGASSELWGD